MNCLALSSPGYWLCPLLEEAMIQGQLTKYGSDHVLSLNQTTAIAYTKHCGLLQTTGLGLLLLLIPEKNKVQRGT